METKNSAALATVSELEAACGWQLLSWAGDTPLPRSVRPCGSHPSGCFLVSRSLSSRLLSGILSHQGQCPHLISGNLCGFLLHTRLVPGPLMQPSTEAPDNKRPSLNQHRVAFQLTASLLQPLELLHAAAPTGSALCIYCPTTSFPPASLWGTPLPGSLPGPSHPTARTYHHHHSTGNPKFPHPPMHCLELLEGRTHFWVPHGPAGLPCWLLLRHQALFQELAHPLSCY